jgi:hypothetical protein
MFFVNGKGSVASMRTTFGISSISVFSHPSRARFRRSERKPQQRSLTAPGKQTTSRNGIDKLLLHPLSCVDISQVPKMSDARLRSVLLPTNIMVDLRETHVFASRTYCSNMQFKVLHAKQGLIEIPDLLEKSATPDRSRNLPNALVRQKSQQVIAGVL